MYAGCWLGAAAAAAAQPAPTAAALDRIEVRATRTRGLAPFDLPAALSVVALDDDRPRPGTSVGEALAGLPGVAARERQNYAQDTQLSVRGFGARAGFGVRGVRLYADGIPATLPDGQGQLAHFALAAAERVELLRGPFSALHGHSSGGVLQLWSAPGGPPRETRAQWLLGAHDTWLAAVRLRDGGERAGYHLAASRFDTGGFRAHGAARRDSVNLVGHLQYAERGRLEWVVNRFDAPRAQDPLGLTRAQARADPRQATAAASLFDTRKSVRQAQGGINLEQGLGASQTLRLAGYRSERVVQQFLAVPVAAQASPLSAGGVIDLDGTASGADLRWSWQGELAGAAAELIAGLERQQQRQRRRGFENFLGAQLGVRGALRRDEANDVDQHDQYLQGWWQPAPRWTVLAGARRSRLAFRARDAYVRAGNPDDSGGVRYGRTTPVAGLSFAPTADLRLYASAGRGFETPTFNELGYRADGGAGLAFDLRPAASRNLELGTKWRNAAGATLEAAWFRAATDDELAVARNVGGRASFRNVGRTRREGFELAWHAPLAARWTLDLSYTRLDARFHDGFALCTSAGCSSPNVTVPAGTRLPGTARDQAFARLAWQPGAWQLGAELVASGPVTVNDVGSERAPGHVLLHLEAARRWRSAHGAWRVFGRIENALDRDWIGSVIVNEGNARYYEPGPGRSLMLGLQWQWDE
jgi:iron complex outermembrane receptor protein